MNDFIPPAYADFEPLTALLERRLLSGEALSEYELLSWLQQPEQAIFAADALRDSLTLFRSHFILMHCLYRLRGQWFARQEALLEISALRIQRQPWQAAHHRLPAAADALAGYYGDLNELATDRETVESLLGSFWKMMLNPLRQEEDLQLLELNVDASEQDIRLQYRRLAMRHHPDRGGDEQHFCRIQAAYQRLKNRYL